METYELVPLTIQNQKSFYRKAIVLVDGDVKTLRSYDTDVATFDGSKATLFENWDSSQATLKHVKAFLARNGVIRDTDNKAAIKSLVYCGIIATNYLTRSDIDDVYALKDKYRRLQPSGHFFDVETLRWFGERLSESSVDRFLETFTDSLGDEHTCYVYRSYQHNAPAGMKRHVSYLDTSTMEQVFKD